MTGKDRLPREHNNKANNDRGEVDEKEGSIEYKRHLFPVVDGLRLRLLVFHALARCAQEVADLLQIALHGHERDRRSDLLLDLLREIVLRIDVVMMVVVVRVGMMRSVIVHHLQSLQGIVVGCRHGAFIAGGLEAFLEQLEFLELIAVARRFDRRHQSVDGMLLVDVRVRHHQKQRSKPFEKDLNECFSRADEVDVA